jgi:hypothetical protein
MPATLEAGVLTVFMETVKEMQKEQMKETRELVLSILQGRPITDLNGGAPSSAPSSQPDPSREPYDPPDYDSPDMGDLPIGIQSIFSREDQETTDLRHLRTEREVLDAQLAEARAALLDPQGPVSNGS